MFAWAVTIIHGILSLVLVYGVLFARSHVAMIAILGTLLLILCGIRYFGGCFVTDYERFEEKPTLTDMGKALSLKEDKAVSCKYFEEIVVANLLIIHLIGMFCRLVLPLEMLF